ncbi:protein HIDE1 isoform X1 [Aquila chrysaetos chrysaetos]|uniref:protein HIDE1 isoform X1 n=1 Tax=Aquila chrysaetos chrysaetos TaxID=223781 RepID=UPI0005D0C979|nr:protein HIDE1 isoform X1 [Aquila chrysaetos chrysaetos]
MRLEFLLFVAGAMAAPRLSPPPLGLLFQEDGGSPKISCFAPQSYAGSTFELFATGADVPAQSVSANPGQHKVDFTLDGTALASRCYRCRYRSYNGSAWQMSAFSMEIVVNASGDAGCHPPTAAPTGRPLPTSTTLRQDRSWLLPVAISVAGLVLLLLAAAAVVACRVKARRQRAKRQQASCWTETRYPTTELSYDNCVYAVSVNAQPGAADGTGTPPVSPQRYPQASPPMASHFSTFRSLA